MAVPRSDCTVDIPESSRRGRQVALTGDASRPVSLDPPVVRFYVNAGPPSAKSPVSDAERVRTAALETHGLSDINFTLDVLRKLPGCLKDGGHKVTLTVREGREVIDIRPGYSGRLYGAAIDLGTTTLAGFLCDMETGEVVSSASGPNPQISMGEDVMARLTYASEDRGREALRVAAQNGISSVIRELCKKAPEGVKTGDVAHTVVVGNTVMLHLLFGLDASNIGAFPFTPAQSSSINACASEVGIDMLPDGRVVSPPVVSGFVGADLVAVAALVERPGGGESLLVADLGTNGEMALFHPGGVLVCSCATGPAFEGAHIRCGMRAATGAIERVVIDPDTLEVSLKVIGGRGWTRPGTKTGARGICGSGVVDALSGMLRAGIIDSRGAFADAGLSPRLFRGEDGEPCFALADKSESSTGGAVVITQSDVGAVQLAKAAVAAGVEILASEAGVAKIDRVLVAGAFGNYIDPAAASAIGMFPNAEPGSVAGIGNAALDGARAMLMSRDYAYTAARFARETTLVELSTHPDFERLFMSCMNFS
jgi:uncharacterized 2Fe-2S/4Fe-4S cluster protein (DUF4445 family)